MRNVQGSASMKVEGLKKLNKEEVAKPFQCNTKEDKKRKV